MPKLKPEKYDKPSRKKKRKAGFALVSIWAWIVSGLLMLAGVILLARWCLGAAFVADYEQGTYREDIPEVMRLVNFPQPHVGDYDMALVKYREGDYQSAAELFYNAVAQQLPEGQDCDARVNLALATCNQMDLEAARAGNDDARQFALQCLYFSRDILIENGCAADDDSFHDEDAQQLKEDIDKLIEELEQNQPPQGGDGDDQDQSQDDQDQPDGGQQEKEDSLKNQLKEQQKQNSQQMQQFQDMQEQMNRYLNGNEEGTGGGKPW